MALRSGREKVRKKVINVLSIRTTLGDIVGKICIKWNKHFRHIVAFILILSLSDHIFCKRDYICFVQKTYEYPQIFITHSYVLRS